MHTARVEATDLLHFHGVEGHPPDLAVTISDQPVICSLDHAHNVSWLPISSGVLHENFPHRRNSNLEMLIGLGIVDIGEAPPLDEAIATCSNEVLAVEHHHLNETLVKRSLLGLVQDQVGLHQVTIPKNQSTILRSADHLAVRELGNTGHIRELKLTKLTDFTL